MRISDWSSDVCSSDLQKAAYSISDTDIGTLLDDPKAVAIMDKHILGFSAREQIDQARPFTLTFIKNFPQADIIDDMLKGIQAAFDNLATATKTPRHHGSPHYTDRRAPGRERTVKAG